MPLRTSGLWVINDGSDGSPPEPKALTYQFPAYYRTIEYIVQVADRTGRFIGELQPWGTLQQVMWRHDTYGTASMLLSGDVHRRAPHLLERGNRVHIRFTNDTLPSWGGVIDPPVNPSQWSTSVTFYAAEYLAGTRGYDAHQVFVNQSAGDIVQALWTGVSSGELIFETHNIDRTGEPLHKDFSPQMLEQMLEGVLSMDDDLHYYLAPKVEGNRLRFTLHVYRGHRADSEAVFIRGMNLTEVELMEQGPIYNHITLASSGGDAPTTYVISDEASIRRYDRRQHFAVAADTDGNGLSSQELGRMAAAMLAHYAAPRKKVAGRAVDVSPARFGRYELGDRVLVELGELGGDPQNAMAVIEAMEYRPNDKTLDIVFGLEQQV